MTKDAAPHSPEHGWVKVRQVIKQLKDNGWRQVRMKGSHRQFRHPDFSEVLTVSGSLGDDMPTGLRIRILKTAGLSYN